MWKKAALTALVLAVAVAWLAFDDLFMPFGVRAEAVEIPDLCGLPVDALENDARFAWETSYRYDPTVPSGTVISQVPSAGSRRRLARGETIVVTLTVSLGEETVTLPSCVGENLRAVSAALREMGCRVRTEYRAGARPEGEVLAMEPRAGTVVPKGSEVVLTVSRGAPTESVEVPNVCGLSRADALTRLWLAGLAAGEVVTVESDVPLGVVVAQSHRAGTLVAAGTRVALRVSGGLEESHVGWESQ